MPPQKRAHLPPIIESSLQELKAKHATENLGFLQDVLHAAKANVHALLIDQNDALKLGSNVEGEQKEGRGRRQSKRLVEHVNIPSLTLGT